MRDEPQARPLSGEILTAGARPGRAAFDAGEIVDADYITLDPQTRREQAHFSAPVAIAPVVAIAGMEMLRKDDAAPRPAATYRGGAGFWLFGLALVAGAFWISGGHALVGR